MITVKAGRVKLKWIKTAPLTFETEDGLYKLWRQARVGRSPPENEFAVSYRDQRPWITSYAYSVGDAKNVARDHAQALADEAATRARR